MGLSDLSRQLGMPRARTHRFLRTLVTMRYVTQDPETERYRLTLKLYHLGQAVADRTGLTTEARPVMIRLRNDFQATVTLSMVEETGMRVLDIVRADSPVQIVTRPGSVLDFHSSAQGKVALAFGPASLRRGLGNGPLKQWTAHTNVDIDKLDAEIELVRQRGWTDAPDQTLAGVNAISAPVFDMNNEMIATISIAGPTQTIGSPPHADLIEQIIRAAKAVSINLGCTEYPA